MGIFNKKEQETGNVLRTSPNGDTKTRGEKKQKQHTTDSKRGVSIVLLPLTMLRNLLDGTLLTHEKVIKNIPFILFVTFLTTIYITNASRADKNRRDYNDLTEELKELRYNYISTKSGVMFESNQSQISLKLKETGIKENITPPVKIFIHSNPEKPE